MTEEVTVTPEEQAALDFKATLGELAKDEQLASFSSTADLAKALIEAKRPQVVPEADKYEVPDGFDKAAIGAFANKTKMTQDQLSQALAFLGEMQAGEKVKADEQYKQGVDALFTEWGNNKDQNLGLAKRTLKQFDDTGEFGKFLDTTGAGNHPMVIKFFATVGKALSEEGFLKSEPNTPPQQKTVAEVLYPNHPNK